MTDVQDLKLSPQQNTIMSLCAILGALHFECTDEVSKQFLTMMIELAAKEYKDDTKDELAEQLFAPPALIAQFRQAIVLMREGHKGKDIKIAGPKNIQIASKNGKIK